ncbi:MAG: jacalin-like lectin domain protein [candidate division Zixibacteria bacterium]|nr:jacalin-like lectin domain protein [candidate division Zixibacteria bacterium]
MRARFLVFLSVIGAGTLLSIMAFAQTPFGPYGGSGGTRFEDMIPAGSRIVEVQIRAGAYIDAIKIFYENGGVRDSFPKRGGNGGQLYRFILDNDEFITGISGRYGVFVDSIIIHTNKRDSPRYGGRGGANQYEVPADQGHIVVGFLGRAGAFVDAIGVITQP